MKHSFLFHGRWVFLLWICFLLPGLVQADSTGFAQVCNTSEGAQICVDGHTYRINSGVVTHNNGSITDPDIFNAAHAANLNTLELDEFDDVFRSVSNATSPDVWNKIDMFMDGAAKNGIHVILNTSQFGQSLAAEGRSAYEVGAWTNYYNFILNRTNHVNGVLYKNDPTILLINIFGEPRPASDMVSFYHTMLAYLRQNDPNHLHSTAGLSDINDGLLSQSVWQSLMTDPNNDICATEINSKGDRDVTMPEVTSFCKGINKPWFLAAWSACLNTGGGDLDNWSTMPQMVTHAQDMEDIVNGQTDLGGHAPAELPIGSSFWSFQSKGTDHIGCDFSEKTPDILQVLRNAGGSVATAPITAPAGGGTSNPTSPVSPPVPTSPVLPSPTPSSPAGTTGTASNMVVQGIGGYCMDVPGGNFNSGAHVQIWNCNGGSNQQWAFESDGTIRTQNNMCLDVPNWSQAQGTLVQIWPCNGGTNQKWTLGKNGSLTTQDGSGMCLDVPDPTYNTTHLTPKPGAFLQIWPCYTGVTNQHWNLTNR